MHAVLLLSATHLTYLRPTLPIYERAAMHHLNQALCAFRRALSEPMTTNNADAWIATSTLLVHHAWASNEWFLHPPASVRPGLGLDLRLDPLFSLSEGLHRIFMNAANIIRCDQSIFAEATRHRPRNSIIQATEGSEDDASETMIAYFEEAYERRHSPLDQPSDSSQEVVSSLPPNDCGCFYKLYDLQLPEDTRGHRNVEDKNDAGVVGFSISLNLP